MMVSIDKCSIDTDLLTFIELIRFNNGYRRILSSFTQYKLLNPNHHSLASEFIDSFRIFNPNLISEKINIKRWHNKESFYDSIDGDKIDMLKFNQDKLIRCRFHIDSASHEIRLRARIQVPIENYHPSGLPMDILKEAISGESLEEVRDSLIMPDESTFVIFNNALQNNEFSDLFAALSGISVIRASGYLSTGRKIKA